MLTDKEKREEVLRTFPKIPRQHLAMLVQRLTTTENVPAFVYHYAMHTLTPYDETVRRLAVHRYDGARAQVRADLKPQVLQTLNQWKGVV